MKLKNRYIPFFMIALAMLFTVACGSDDGEEESAEEANTNKLAHEWAVGDNGSVSRDGNDVTSKYAEFSILFSSSNSYIVQGDPDNVMYPSGTWQFNGDNYSQVLLNGDERPIAIEYADNDQTLVMTFMVTEDVPLGSRTEGVSGEFIFRLSR